MLYVLLGMLVVGLIGAFWRRTTAAFLAPGMLLLALLVYLLFYS